MEAARVELASEDLAARISPITVSSLVLPWRRELTKLSPRLALYFLVGSGEPTRVYRLVDARVPRGGVAGLTTALIKPQKRNRYCRLILGLP